MEYHHHLLRESRKIFSESHKFKLVRLEPARASRRLRRARQCSASRGVGLGDELTLICVCCPSTCAALLAQPIGRRGLKLNDNGRRDWRLHVAFNIGEHVWARLSAARA